MRAVLVVAAAALLSGCTASPTLDRLTGDAPAPDPIFLVEREDVGATHDRSFVVDVGDRARELNVTVALETRAPALASGVHPARLDVEVLTPAGERLANATLDSRAPRFAFATSELAERGTYAVRIHGQGVSETLQGQEYGASYLITLEVLHS